MALPHQNLTPREVAFIAEAELVTIIPRQRLDPLNLISISTLPLIPPQRATVPLWLAILLRKQKRCNIIPPDWLNVQNLERLVREETDSDEFANLPWRWMEVGELLLDACPEDLGPGSVSGEIALHLRSLRELRQTKIRAGIRRYLNSTVMVLQGAGFMEVNEVRPWVGKVVDGLRKIEGESGGRESAQRVEEDEMDEDDY